MNDLSRIVVCNKNYMISQERKSSKFVVRIMNGVKKETINVRHVCKTIMNTRVLYVNKIFIIYIGLRYSFIPIVKICSSLGK